MSGAFNSIVFNQFVDAEEGAEWAVVQEDDMGELRHPGGGRRFAALVKAVEYFYIPDDDEGCRVRTWIESRRGSA